MDTWQFATISSQAYRDWYDANRSLLRDRSPFHQPDWLETVAQGVNFKTGYIGIYTERELVAAIPGFLARRGPFQLYGSPLRGTMTSFLGPVSLQPLWSGQDRMEGSAACASFVRRTWGGAYLRFTLRDAPATRQKQNGDWKDQRPGTYRLDLSGGTEGLWKGLKSDCRRNIRRAQDAGMEIVPFEDAGLFYHMIDATFRRHNSTSWHKENFFRMLFTRLIPRDLLWAWGVKYEGKIIAGALFLHDDRDVVFISGASLPQYGSLPTSYLLHWNAIELAAKIGLKTYHSDKSRVPTIDKFKESFRPVLEHRQTLIWAPRYVRSAEKFFIRAVARMRAFNSRVGTANEHPGSIG